MRSYSFAVTLAVVAATVAARQPVPKGREVGPFPGQVFFITPSPDGAYLLVGGIKNGGGHELGIWDVKTGVQKARTDDPRLLRGVFTADGNGVVLARRTEGGGMTVQKWDFLAGPPGDQVPLPGVSGTVHFAPGGKSATTVVRAAKDAPVELAGWTLDPPVKVWTHEIPPLKLDRIDAVPGGLVYLVFKVDDFRNPCKLLTLDPKTGKTVKADLPYLVNPDVTDDGKLYVDTVGGNAVVALDATGKVKWTTKNLPNAVTAHTHGRHVVVKHQGTAELAVLDAADGKLLRRFDLSPERPGATAVSADGKTLNVSLLRGAAGSRQGFVRALPIAGK